MTAACTRLGVLVALGTSVLLIGLPRQAAGQVVRGRITEGGSSVGIPGVLVSLLPAGSDSTVANALSAGGGEYAIRAPAPGRYRVAAKRVGVRRYVSAPVDVSAGETVRIDVSLDVIAQTLPEVEVPGLCVSRESDVARVSALWDEARTALQATEISQRDQLVRATLVRHAAELDPASLGVLFDWRSEANVLVERPFVSLSGDSLSELGYWQMVQGDSLVFSAPDASALLSNAFMRDHCFAPAGADRSRPDLVGIDFRPARDRTRGDIAGTIWLDARRYELRHVVFRYTGLPPIPPADRLGGEVHFARAGSAAWIVDRWFIRMPHMVIQPGLDPQWILREEGGSVRAAEIGIDAATADVHGIVRDSSGRPLAGATVRAVGTGRQVTAESDGRYRLDGIPIGDLSVVVHDTGYDAHGLLLTSRRLALRSGATIRFDVRAPRAVEIIGNHCPRRMGQRPSSALRMVLVDSATTAPIPNVRFRFAMQRTWIPSGREGEREIIQERVTDSRGVTMLCLNAAPAFPVDVSVVGADGAAVPVVRVPVAAGELATRVVSVRVNR